MALAAGAAVALQPAAMLLPAAAMHSAAGSVHDAAFATPQQSCGLVAGLALLAVAVADALEEVGLEVAVVGALAVALALTVPASPRLLGALPAAAPPWPVGKVALTLSARQVALPLWASAGQRPSPGDQPVVPELCRWAPTVGPGQGGFATATETLHGCTLSTRSHLSARPRALPHLPSALWQRCQRGV